MKESWKIEKRHDNSYVLSCSWNMISLVINKDHLDNLKKVLIDDKIDFYWMLEKTEFEDFWSLSFGIATILIDFLLPEEEINSLKETLIKFKETKNDYGTKR